MTEMQNTIARPVSVEGTGLHTGQQGKMTFYPAPANHGVKFRRIDLTNQPVIDALIDNLVDTSRGTTIGTNGVRVYTIEHVMATLTGLGIDNVLIDLDMEEIPIKDGSAKYFVEALKLAGTKELEAKRDYLVITEEITLSDKEKGFELKISPADTFKVDVTIDYATDVLNTQQASLHDLSLFADEIAPCRTFVFLHELEFLLNHNLIKGGDLSNAIVFMNRQVSQQELDRLAELFNKPKVKVKDEGILNNLDLHFPNEPARHKLLDVIGDLSLLGKPIKGHIKAYKPGHYANTSFAKQIKEKLNIKAMNKKPPFDIYAQPVFDVLEIQRMLPHRPPFLLVDKILEISNEHIIGLKSVTMNEPFFLGHFPQEPVMPGVLMVEAMAQTGGILVLHSVPDPENYITYFLKIEEAKFRNKVVPGDVLVFVLEFLSPVRRGICNMKGVAYVGDKVVMEARLMAQIARKQ